MLNREESIVIYYNFVPRHSVGRTNVTNYYFSIGIDGTVQNLTIKNLKEAFTDNTKFQELIDKNLNTIQIWPHLITTLKCIKLIYC